MEISFTSYLFDCFYLRSTIIFLNFILVIILVNDNLMSAKNAIVQDDTTKISEYDFNFKTHEWVPGQQENGYAHESFHNIDSNPIQIQPYVNNGSPVRSNDGDDTNRSLHSSTIKQHILTTHQMFIDVRNRNINGPLVQARISSVIAFWKYIGITLSMVFTIVLISTVLLITSKWLRSITFQEEICSSEEEDSLWSNSTTSSMTKTTTTLPILLYNPTINSSSNSSSRSNVPNISSIV